MKRKLFYLSLMVMLLVLQVLPVSAQSVMVGDGATMKATDLTARSGAEAEVMLSLTGCNKRIETLGVVFEFDATKLTLDLEKSEWVINREDKVLVKNPELDSTDNKYYASWTGNTPDVVNGDFLKLTFKTTADTSVKEATVTAVVTAKSGSAEVFTKTVVAKVTIVNGVTVRGNCVSYGEGDVCVELLAKDEAKTLVKTAVIEEGTYSIPTVLSGEYILRVSKEKSAPREYEITVGETDVTQDVKICLYGDFNMDGKVSAEDITALARTLGGLDSCQDDYQKVIGNVNVREGNEALGAEDVTAIARFLGGLDTELGVSN